jgi:hypothetical protein
MFTPPKVEACGSIAFSEQLMPVIYLISTSAMNDIMLISHCRETGPTLSTQLYILTSVAYE